jgi:hypothetical protein
MFAAAYEKASAFTRPVIISTQAVDGTCRSTVASMVIVNRDGWFLSAWHVNKMIADLTTAKGSYVAYLSMLSQIRGDATVSEAEKKRRQKKLHRPANDAVANWSVWWSFDGVQAVEITGIPDADLMLGRLTPFDPALIRSYPTFRDVSTPLRPATSLCRLGFPFPSVAVTFDSTKQQFAFAQGSTLAMFPIDGIFTRQVMVSQNPAGYQNAFIETSSPGLRGQSGGPIFDVNATVWGIQSQTKHLSLGFDPVAPVPAGSKVPGSKEHQFLNVGWGTHPATIAGLLKEKGVAHSLAL